MASPLELASYVQGQFNQGRERRDNNRLAALASQAYGADPDAQRGLVQQAIATNPDAGFALGQNLGRDRNARMLQMAQMAKMLVGYAEGGNRAGVDSIYPRLAQEAQSLGLGSNIPGQWDDSYLPGIKQLAQIGGGDTGNVVHSQRVGEDGFIYNTMRDGSLVNTGVKADRQMWFRDHPGMAPQLVGKDGSVNPVGVPQATQAPQQFAPPRQGEHPNEEAILAQANAASRSGVPQDQIEAWMQQQLSQAPAPVPSAMQAPAAAPQGGALPPRLDYTGGGLARPSEAQTAAEVEAARQRAQLSYLPQELGIRTQAALDQKAGEASITTGAKAAEAQAERDATLALYETAMRGLQDGLDMTTTGPVVGRLPAVTTGQQIAEGGVAAMAPILKQLFRAAGEGTFTDKDQELLLDMVPTRKDSPEARAVKMQNIDNIVRAKLRAPGSGGSEPARITSAEDYNRLPSGAVYIAPDGTQRRKR